MNNKRCMHVENRKTHHANFYYDNTMFMTCEYCINKLRSVAIDYIYYSHKEDHLWNIELREKINKLCCRCKKQQTVFIMIGSENDGLVFYKCYCANCFNQFDSGAKRMAMKIVD